MKYQKTSLTSLACILLAVAGTLGLTPVRVRAQVTSFVPNCSGIDDTAEFTFLIDGAGGNPRTITIPYYDDLTRRCKVTTLTVPANITLDNTNGIGIALDSPNVLTVLGPLVNPVGKTLFFGSGTTSFAGNTFVGANGQARLSNGAGVDTWGTPTGLIPDTRSVNTTSPLTGGGDLSADRTIACDTCAVTINPLSQFTDTTSAQLAGVVSDETGTGAAVFGTAPTFTTSITSPIVYGGPAVGSTQTIAGSSNAAPASSYVRVNPQVVSGTSPAGLFVGAPTSKTFDNGFISDQLHLQGSDGKVTALVMDSYGSLFPMMAGRAAGGTAASPTATAAGAGLLVLGGEGYETNTPGFTLNVGSIKIMAAEAMTKTAQGSYISFLTTPIGSATNAERLRIYSKGDILIGTTANPTANSGKVLAFGENGATNPTMGVSTAGLFAKNVSGTTRLFAIDEDGTATQLTEDSTHRFVTDAEKSTWNSKQDALGYTAENQANKSTDTSLGTSDILYPTQNAVKTYVDNHVGGGGGGANPNGNDGDLQMKAGLGLAPSAINDNGTVLSVSRPFELRQSDTNFARWTFNGNNSLSLAATLAAPPAPTASLVTDGTGNCTAGTHQFKVTYVTAGGETNASTPSNQVICDAANTKVLISLPTGSTTNGVNTVATARNIYATTAGGSTYFLIASSPVVNDNATPSYIFDLADGSFTTTQAPLANTAVDSRIFVDNLGNVGIGTTSPQFTDDSQGRSVAIDGGTAEGYLGIGATSITNVTGRVGALNFYNIAQGSVDHRVAAIMAFNDGALATGRLRFYTTPNAIGPLVAGSIDSQQNWGIGREATTGVKLIVQAGSAVATDRVLSIENNAGSAAFLNFWNDGRFELSNGNFQVDDGPFQVSSAGDVTGRSVQLTSAAKPACDATSRGTFWYVAGGAGVKDTVEVCAKDAADAYAWRTIY